MMDTWALEVYDLILKYDLDADTAWDIYDNRGMHEAGKEAIYALLIKV